MPIPIDMTTDPSDVTPKDRIRIDDDTNRIEAASTDVKRAEGTKNRIGQSGKIVIDRTGTVTTRIR